MGGGATVQTLREFLKDEREAAAQYRRARPRFTARFTDRAEADELDACLASHEQRIARLERLIRDRGGEIGQDDVEVAAGADVDDVGISSLEETEDRSLKHYLDDVGKLDGDARRLIAREILPEQVRTYDWVNDLRLSHLG